MTNELLCACASDGKVIGNVLTADKIEASNKYSFASRVSSMPATIGTTKYMDQSVSHTKSYTDDRRQCPRSHLFILCELARVHDCPELEALVYSQNIGRESDWRTDEWSHTWGEGGYGMTLTWQRSTLSTNALVRHYCRTVLVLHDNDTATIVCHITRAHATQWLHDFPLFGSMASYALRPSLVLEHNLEQLHQLATGRVQVDGESSPT